jgi:4-amino-4-deoxy-L-arabinose transferase-like glycosyltransferase
MSAMDGIPQSTPAEPAPSALVGDAPTSGGVPPPNPPAPTESTVSPHEPALELPPAREVPPIPEVLPAPSVTATPTATLPRLRYWDYLLLTAFCLLLFGFYMFCGRPLSLHEARLPETSREMLANHNWIFPQSGGRPWLERPPFPHWIEIGVSLLSGQKCDTEWVVRLPSVLMGTFVVLLTAWMASLWFGRMIGLLSGFVLATMFEFYKYSILAEDDIFLAALVVLAIALFVHMEFASGKETDRRVNFLGNRPWQVWAFFIVVGITNLAKSPLLGMVVVVGTVGLFLLLSGQWLRIRRYIWETGWILAIVLSAAWALAAMRAYPDVLQNWKFDYKDTSQYDEPFWYYPVALLSFCVPWIPLAIPGLILTFKQAAKRRGSGELFLWCWAIVPVILLSVPHRKHHHYLVPSIAPWAILSAIGLQWLWRIIAPPQGADRPLRVFLHALIPVGIGAVVTGIGLAIFHAKIPIVVPAIIGLAAALLACIYVFGVSLARRNGPVAAAAWFVAIAIAYCWGQKFTPDYVVQDTQFLRRVEKMVPSNEPLYVNSDLGGEMDFFRNQFYLRSTAKLLHNLSYLRDRSITAPAVWVVTRNSDETKLQTLGEVEIADESKFDRREHGSPSSRSSPKDRFTLFHLKFFPDLQRYPRPAYVNTLQAMGREPGPDCGPPGLERKSLPQ